MKFGFLLGMSAQQEAEAERMLIAMREMNEQIARDQAAGDQLKAETREIIRRMQERPPLNIPWEDLTGGKRTMEQANVWEISKEEAGQLSGLLDQCVKVLGESNARSENTFAEIAELRAETEANLKQLRTMFNVEASA
ncbi:MAG: hypothetical protein HOP19_01985 [Acidobacteria bacterium]|nr:hypothetical protein [Acidobacteriota bacterium]